ncbi:MAG: hypothetical protein ABSF71_30870 [Terriglobia bacterium]|jgi:REP element-mobilizing transposase RayT
MEKVGVVKLTSEDMVVLYEDHPRILLRHEVGKDDTHMIHEIKLDDKQAQDLAALLQKSSEQVCARVEQEKKEQAERQLIELHLLPKVSSPDQEP